MRRALRWTLVLLLPAILLAVWVVPALVSDTRYDLYDLTCCARADLDRVWQPGTVAELHWSVLPVSVPDRLFDRFESNPTHQIFINASLQGPYSDLAAVKEAIRGEPTSGGYRTLSASGITLDDRTLPTTRPVLILQIPADLPPGYYDLGLILSDGKGGIGDPTNFVRVGQE